MRTCNQNDIATWPIPSLTIIRGTGLGAPDPQLVFRSGSPSLRAVTTPLAAAETIGQAKDSARQTFAEQPFSA